MGFKKLSLLHNSLEHLPNPHICLLQLGWEACKPGYSFLNCRDLYLIHFIQKGRGSLFIHDRTHHLEKNDVFLIRPNVPATYTADMDEPWTYFYFAFNGSLAPELIQRTLFRDNISCATLSDDLLSRMIIEAIENMDNKQAADIYGLEQLFRFISVLIADDTKSRFFLTQQHQYVVRVQRYIQLHFSKPIQISEIADFFNIDRSYLYRIFRDYTGLSPKEYLINFRLQQAKQLLCDSQMPISEIAEIVGYNSYSNFYTSFSERIGISPKQYRDIQKAVKLDKENQALQSRLE